MRFTPYVLAVTITALLATAVAIVAWRRRPAPGATPLALLGLAVAAWSYAYAFELASTTPELVQFWVKLEYPGIVITPLAWLAFALHYTGRERRLTRFRIAMLAKIPIITVLLAWTNELHHLIWQEVTFDAQDSLLLFDPTYGPWFWVHTAFSYLAIGTGTILLLRSALRSMNLYRRQAAVAIFSAVLPWIGNVLYLSDLVPGPQLDLTPFAFTLSCLALVLGFFRYRLLDVVPVARDLIIENMSDGVVVIDDQNRIVDLNPIALNGLQMPSSMVIGKLAFQVFARWPDMVERYRNVHEIAEEVITNDGNERRYIDLRISPLRDHHRRIRGRLIVWRDITTLKQTEEMLRRQNEELTALHETSLALINRLDPQNVIEAIVARAGALVGTAHGYLYVVDPAADELVIQVGTGVFACHLQCRLKRGQGLSGQVWETGQPLAINDYAQWPGHHFDFDWLHALVGIPLRSGTEVIGVLGLAYLDTDRTFDPEEVALLERFGRMASLVLANARLYAELQQELTERKRTEAALHHAKDAAEAANRAKSTFLANMSHELRTPLTIILGYSQLLQMQAREQGYAELIPELESISAAGNHLLSLISDILDLSKIEAGRMELHLNVFSVAELIDELATAVRPMVEQRNNTFAVRYQDDLGTMQADATKVRQILFNLLSNAAKFTERGVVTFTAARLEEHGAHWILFRVIDTGIGISSEQMTYLFKEFTQADDSASRRHGGTGLGLAISRHFCQMMGGDISVESEVGRGSTFTVRLPTNVGRRNSSSPREAQEMPEGSW